MGFLSLGLRVVMGIGLTNRVPEYPGNISSLDAYSLFFGGVSLTTLSCYINTLFIMYSVGRPRSSGIYR